MKFNELGLSQKLLEKIKFDEPTLIQEKSIPLIMEGRDVVGESATGSGKTLAFGIGIAERLNGEGLQSLILTPTRELAEQVKNSIKKLGIDSVAIYGGVSMGPQIDGLRTAKVAVATPGRMLDLLDRGHVNTSKIKMIVLDEADTMLDMGFIDDVEKILSQCPRERQTLFFSATIRGRIKDVIRKYMKNPEKVVAKKMVDPTKLKQKYYNVEKNKKLSLAVSLLQKNPGLSMVFCNSRRTVDFVSKSMNKNGIKALAIHGGFTQNKRKQMLSMFNNQKVDVLVCTDVAARGLHISDVTHVYNYDIPRTPKEYVHRIGRTARAGEEGKVVNLLCEYDYDNFGRIQQEFREFSIDKTEVPQLRRINIARVAAKRWNGNRNRRRR